MHSASGQRRHFADLFECLVPSCSEFREAVGTGVVAPARQSDQRALRFVKRGTRACNGANARVWLWRNTMHWVVVVRPALHLTILFVDYLACTRLFRLCPAIGLHGCGWTPMPKAA
jgi:hypothetical protein